jgi:multiple sugar transport system substrate-binding protein
VGDSGEIIGLTDEQKADFIESYYNEGLVYGDNQMYTMPLNKSTEVLYYNKTFFEENGLSVPTTWDEMWDVCEKILAIDPTCYPLGYDAEENWFITLCEQMKTGYTSASGEHYLFNNDANKAFIKTLRENYEKGYFTTQELYGAYTSGLFTNQDPTKARCYMCIGSSGGASYQIPKTTNEAGETTFAFEVGVAQIPQYDANNKKVISQGPSVCILKGKDTTDQQIMASWLFTKFLCTNVDFQAEFSMTSGYMPVLKSVVNNEAYAAWLNSANGYENLVATCVKVGIEGRNDYFVSPAFNGSSAARVQVGSLLIKCISTKTDNVDTLLKNAFQDAQDECEFQGG